MESDRTRSAALGALAARPARAPLSGPHIAGLATADSAQVFTQPQVLERLGLKGDEFAEGIFARCGVQRRHLDLGEDFMARTLQGRADQIERDLMGHAVRAVDALGLDTSAVRTVMTSSLYTLGCPTLAHRLVEHYRLDPCTDKYHVSGVGCASAVPLMRLATQALAAGSEEPALVVAADSLSGILTHARPEDPRAKTVGASIFGDGCAAALISNDPRAGGPRIAASQVHQIAGTLDAVVLELSGEDGYLNLARELPAVASAGLLQIVERFLGASGLRREDIDHWMVHPGGRRIIEGVRDSLELDDEDVATSWETLAEYGNVGTPAIFYVLKDTIERREPSAGEHGLMITIGPGVTVGLMLLAW